MAGLSIRVEVKGDLRPFERCISRLANCDFASLHRKIGNALVNETLEAFQRGESPWGQKWKPSLRAQGLVPGKKAGKTLLDTARLRNSIHARATAEMVEVGTDVVYARIHQLGGKAGRWHRTRLPARPYLPADERGLAPHARDLVEQIVKAQMEEAVR